MTWLTDVGNWLGAEWKWIGTTAIALYGAWQATVTRRRQGRQEKRELDRDKHLLKLGIGIHRPHDGGPGTVHVQVTNRGWRTATIEKVEFVDRSVERGRASVGFGYPQAEPVTPLPKTLEPDSALALFKFPVDAIKANFTHIVVTDSHDVAHEYERTENFDLMWRAAHGDQEAIAELDAKTKEVLLSRAHEARGLPEAGRPDEPPGDAESSTPTGT